MLRYLGAIGYRRNLRKIPREDGDRSESIGRQYIGCREDRDAMRHVIKIMRDGAGDS